LPFDYSQTVGDSKDRIAADVVDDAEIVRTCCADCHAHPWFTPTTQSPHNASVTKPGRATRAPVWCTAELGCIAANCILHSMTRALDAAIAKLSELSAEEQDRIARWLLDELGDEEMWARQFAASQDALSKLAAEARGDRVAGRATELDPDKL